MIAGDITYTTTMNNTHSNQTGNTEQLLEHCVSCILNDQSFLVLGYDDGDDLCIIQSEEDTAARHLPIWTSDMGGIAREIIADISGEAGPIALKVFEADDLLDLLITLDEEGTGVGLNWSSQDERGMLCMSAATILSSIHSRMDPDGEADDEQEDDYEDGDEEDENSGHRI